jgi:hypothetical protein
VTDASGSTERRGYSWLPFQPGHTLTLTHGARSPRSVAPIAHALAGELLDVAPWCAQPAFSAEVEAWAWAEARCRLLRAWLDEHALLDDDDEPRAALNELHRAEARAESGRNRLGLNPAAWSKLLASLASIEDKVGAAADSATSLREVGAAILKATTRQDPDPQASVDGSGAS